ncbi:MAG TPA: HpcH/HpaI aldolase/citrate lyase family protein [Methylomusa anaerophila]|uniref:Citrate lyase subunit beta n=1 Tax=Methylomusa anaerophila TaxID=1930071 RepID=A0A348AK66_9FIRM|nr:HpcH/HpaI aldolase/citrate lyase family protein [Methylomusa anaerophila]BBB91464.1 hypothetical protein MAMMFC1_02148 [Methylomusa anaerophila]HML89946.1 HpcH/HpaI aldolase/citrate lyase family protein [Methylomusa anaerophila]
MRYFNYLSDEQLQDLFYMPPQSTSVSDKSLLEYALGATLYMPATRKTVAQDIAAGKLKGLTSMVLCLEDAIGDGEVVAAEEMIVAQIRLLAAAINKGELLPERVPLIFLRVRDVQQMVRISERLAYDLELLTGFVFPKFTPVNGVAYFEALAKINRRTSKPLYGMPILESPEYIYIESRCEQLQAAQVLLNQFRDLVLNVRIGATDLCGLFGLRRSPDETIYDIALIKDSIADIVNIFTRPDSMFVVSAPVWEFFSSGRVLKPLLRQSPFVRLGRKGGQLRDQLVCRYIDGLIHEVILDKANGLTGKTIIHPSHIRPVQSLYVVTHEEYIDALSIINNGKNGKSEVGVIASQYANKMNEIKPHLRWAQKILIKSRVYGVFNEQHNFTSLLEA